MQKGKHNRRRGKCLIDIGKEGGATIPDKTDADPSHGSAGSESTARNEVVNSKPAMIESLNLLMLPPQI